MRAKKVLSAILATAFLLGLLPASVLAAQAEGNWYDAAMSVSVERGILAGDEKGDLQPGRSITRGELAVMLDRIMDYQVKASNSFHDLAAGVYYTDAILGASAAGILKGDDNGNVSPAAAITRQETAVMLARVMGLDTMGVIAGGFTDQTAIASWAVGAVNAMKVAGYMGAKETAFRPADSITRAEVATVLGNIFSGYFNKAETYSADVNGSAVINAAGVTLKNMKVSGDLLIAEGVGTGDVNLDGVTIGGKLLVRGGGVNSIHIKGASQVGTVIVSRQDGKIRVSVEGGAKVEVVVVNDGSDEVKIDGTVGTLRVESAAQVEVTGKVDTIAVNAEEAKLKVSGSVGKVETTENAVGTIVETTSTGKITAVEAAGTGTQITGTGKVEKVSAQANNVKVTTPNTKVEAAEGISGVTAGGKEVKPGETSSTPGSSTGGGSYVPPVDNSVANVSDLAGLTAALKDTTKTTINITSDISEKIAETIEVNRAVTINGKGRTLSFNSFTNNPNGKRNGLLIAAANVTVNDLKIVMGEPVVGGGPWHNGVYGIQVYGVKNVTLHNYTGSGGDAALVVNGATVTLTGTTTVSGNELGGIEVAKGTAEGLENSLLTIGGTLVNATEAATAPTVWVIDGEGTMTDNGETLSYTKQMQGKTYHYITAIITTAEELRNVLSDGQSREIRLANDLSDITDTIEVERPVTIDGNGKRLSFLSLAGKADGKRNGLLIKASGVTIKGVTVEMEHVEGWKGIYGIQVYGSEGVTIQNYTGTGGDAALLVNGSTVTLTGTTTVSNNEFGGIEVAKGTAEGLENSLLTIGGTIVNASETADKPTAWVIVGQGGISDSGKLLGGELKIATEKIYFYVTSDNRMEKLLKLAAAYKYADYSYKGTSAINGGTVTYTPGSNEPSDMMNDMARFLGALWRIDEGANVKAITYDGLVYNWSGNLHGSNWKSGDTSLVSVIVNKFKDPRSAPEILTFTINGADVVFAIGAGT